MNKQHVVIEAKKQKNGVYAAAGVAAGTALVSTSASAAVDVSAAITAFSDINTAIPLIGAAFLGALAILALWKLLRGAFS